MKFNIHSEEGQEDRTEISLNGIGSVTLVETFPEYEFIEDVDEDTLEELGVEEGDLIGKIEHIVVNDEHKGKGYGRLLMNKAIEVAKEKGLMPLYLNATPMGYDGLDIDDLTGFYESFGFEVFLQQGRNNLMILKDTYKIGGQTKNKIMEKQIKMNFEQSYADGGEPTEFKKGGNVSSIEKRVEEVNKLIELANANDISVIDSSTTWQSPMKYKPIRYSNGVLYIEYQELDLYKYNRTGESNWVTKKDKVLKRNMEFDNPLNDIAKMYRKALRESDIDYKSAELNKKEPKKEDIGFDDEGTNMVMYHEEKGNFMIPKGQIYLWLYEGEKIGEKLQNEEYDWVFYPYANINMSFQKGFIPPLKRIWTKKFQKDHKGSEHLLGVIKAYLIEKEGQKELYIDMMSVNPTKMKKGIMSYMIKELRDTFNLTQDQVTFSKLTPEGEKFVAKKTYADGGDVNKPYIYYYYDGENDITFRTFEEAYNEVKRLGYSKFRDNLGGEYFVEKEYETVETVAKRFDKKEDAQNWINDNSKNSNSKFRIEEVPYDSFIDYRVMEKYERRKMADGGGVPHEDKMFQLPLEMVVYVPSTQDVDKVISVDEMDKRVDEVKKYLADKFGGYTSADKLGGFVDSTGNLVNEDVTQVTSFSTQEAYDENKEELINQLAKWGKQWGQEAIGFEFEGDLMYVPQELNKKNDVEKFRRGGFMYEVQKKGSPSNDMKETLFTAKNLTELKKKIIEKYGTSEGFMVRRRTEQGYFVPVKFADGGEAAEYQIIDKKTEKYYSRSISDGKIKWNDSPDMGYMFTMKDANQIKESLHQSGYEQLEVVKYDANWWRKAKYEKGGAIYPDLSLQKADVVNDSITLNEFEIKKMKNTFKIDGIEKLKITSSQDAVNILRKLFDEDTINAYEQAYILYLNNNNKVIGYYHHSSGSVTGTVMDVQMISGMALKSLAKGVIIAHNHPSENTIPSDADKRITKQLQNALNIFNIVLMDSIILTDDSYTSFAIEGLL